MSDLDKELEQINYMQKKDIKYILTPSQMIEYEKREKLADIATKQAFEKHVIGEELEEGDGWDWAFGKEAQCCPGDDFAYFGNHIKKLQRESLWSKD